MLLGEFNHQLDDKSRIRLPAKLRREFIDGYVLTRGTNGCLFVFSLAEISKLIEKVNTLPLSDVEAWKPIRYILASATEIEEDEQGRFVLPSNLRNYAKIVKNTTIIGVGNRVEIWSEENWNFYLANGQTTVSGSEENIANLDSIIQNLKGYGI